MSAVAFVDSNILIYAHDLDAGVKRERAAAKLRELWDSGTRATEISELARISFWDALIVASAEEVDADELLSEDLNDGQAIAGIKVVNPFKVSHMGL